MLNQQNKHQFVIGYVLVHVLISLVNMWFFIDAFGLPLKTLALHFMLLLTIHVFFVMMLGLASDKRIWQIVLALLLSLYWYYLLLLYGLNWFSHLNWGSNVLFDFIVHLPKQVVSISSTENIPLFWVVFSASVVWLILVVLARILIRKTAIMMNNRFSLTNKAVLYALAFTGFVAFYVSVTYKRDDPRDWVFEPLLSSISLNSSEYHNNRSKIQALQDQKIQTAYQQKLETFEPKTNVILIIADALRFDRLPTYGYAKPTTPFISSLQQNPGYQQVDYFSSTCSESICGIYSILSSRQYSYIGFDLYGLPEVLQTAGYSKHYILSSNHNYNALNKLYGSDFDTYIDGNQFPSPLTLHDDEGVITTLNEIPSFDEQPAFFYFHLMSSHQLGKNKEPFNRYQPFIEHVPGFVGKKITDDVDRLSEQLSNAYDNGIFQLDDYIRRIHEILSDKGYLDDSIVIITGDHGDGLGERGYFFHTYNLFHEDINVPLIWYAPGCELNNTRYGTQIDIAPTVLDCLEIPIPETWHGVSLLEEYQENRITIHQTLRENKTIMAVLENQNHMYKLMARQFQGVISDFRLFDYYQDNQELIDLYPNAEPEVIETLKTALLQHFE